MIDLSIIIVNWNTRNILRDCLESVYTQTKGISFETIVIDNASADGSAEMVKSSFADVILIENTENKGFAAANNQGIQIARGDYILLLNSDTIVLDNAIEKTLQFARKLKDAAAVGCKILNKDMTLQPNCFMFPSILNMLLSSLYLYKIFPKSRFFAREQMGFWDRNDIRQVDVVTGCFILVKKTVLDDIGLLDEDYFVYGEETDLCYRFVKRGYKNYFYPNAQIIHLGGASSSQIKPKMALQLRASILFFFRKHRSYIAYLTACGFISLFFAVRLPYWLLKAALKKKDRTNSLNALKTYSKGAMLALLGYRALAVKR
jgi:GT2 family glycosyltransferase